MTMDIPAAGLRQTPAQHSFDTQRLNAWMQGHIAGFSGPIEVQQFAGGQSNPTYLVQSPSGRYVLRRKPPGKLLPSAHAVDREFRVLAALKDSPVPVARVHALCEDPEVIGSVFYVMDYVEGRIFWDAVLPEVAAPDRRAIYSEMVRVLAALHSVDYAAVGLGDYGKPGRYIERQVARWTQQYRASETEKLEAMERLIEWLPPFFIPPSRASWPYSIGNSRRSVIRWSISRTTACASICRSRNFAVSAASMRRAPRSQPKRNPWRSTAACAACRPSRRAIGPITRHSACFA
jgi:hypothetical protein